MTLQLTVSVGVKWQLVGNLDSNWMDGRWIRGRLLGVSALGLGYWVGVTMLVRILNSLKHSPPYLLIIG